MDTTASTGNQEDTKKETTSGGLDYAAAKRAALITHAINHKMRQKMLNLIGESKRISVTDIYVKLHLEQSVASQHLGILRKAHVVEPERDGKNIYYMLNYARLSEISQLVNNLVHAEVS